MPNAPAHLPVESLPERAVWAAQLKRIAQEPLSLCPQFPRIAQRFEAWWHQELLDRPLLIAAANGNPARPIDRRLELLHDADAWLAAKRADVAQTHRVCDALPTVRVDFGPVTMGPLFGAKTEYQADTSWTHPFIDDDWSNRPAWTIAPDNDTWLRLQDLTHRAAAAAPGHFLVCTPDLGGSADVLMNVRGPDQLCLDALDRPDFLREQVDAIYPAWRQAFAMLYARTVPANAGIVHWLGVWSNEPYMIPACDFNYMIGPEEFDRICLGDIARQAATAGRAVFHLDGPGAARHIDALLTVPHIRAIQFTPGEGTPSVKPWVDMFRKIQSQGRSLLIITPKAEVDWLCQQVDPAGLAMLVVDCRTPQDADDVAGQLFRRYGCQA